MKDLELERLVKQHPELDGGEYLKSGEFIPSPTRIEGLKRYFRKKKRTDGEGKQKIRETRVTSILTPFSGKKPLNEV